MKIIFSRLSAVLIAAGAIFSFSGCNDDSPPSRTPLLVDKTWTVSIYTIGGTDAMEECIADNSMIFFNDGTYADEIGTVTCEEDETDSEGLWKFKGNESMISLQPEGDLESDWEILELTDKTFSISQYVDMIDAEVVIVMTVN